MVALKSIHPLQQDKNQLPGAEINSDKPVDKLTKNKDYYFENGLMVLTAHFLKNRGYCCGNGCRHCPFKK
ncbi:MAG: DUF5522 domain-containing protein [Saprospiraceae bacterium]